MSGARRGPIGGAVPPIANGATRRSRFAIASKFGEARAYLPNFLLETEIFLKQHLPKYKLANITHKPM